MIKEDVKPGIPVIYWKEIDSDTGEKKNPVRTYIDSEPWQAGSSWICNVKGISGGVDIEHLEQVVSGNSGKSKITF